MIFGEIEGHTYVLTLPLLYIKVYNICVQYSLVATPKCCRLLCAILIIQAGHIILLTTSGTMKEITDIKAYNKTRPQLKCEHSQMKTVWLCSLKTTNHVLSYINIWHSTEHYKWYVMRLYVSIIFFQVCSWFCAL